MKFEEIKQKNLILVPDKIIVAYSDTNVIYNQCIKCKDRFFPFYSDEILCSQCHDSIWKFDIPDKNISEIYFENIIGWEMNVPSSYKRRFLNYKKCLIRDMLTCQYCGWNPFLGGDKTITVDHVIPFSYSQSNKLENLKCACSECNKLLYNKMFDSYFDKKSFVLKMRESKNLKNHYFKELNQLKDKIPAIFSEEYVRKLIKTQK